MTRPRLILLLLAILALLAGLGLWLGQRSGSGLPLAAPPRGGDFTLLSAQGPVSTQAFRGKVVVVYFGYTYCPDICPTSLATLGAALGQLSPAELAQVQPLFVSVDPQRDTPARLKEYAAFFHPKLIGLTGSPQTLAAAAKAYGASYSFQPPDARGNYVVDHSAFTYLVDTQGHLADTLPHGASPEDTAAAIRRLLPH